jgi:O-antigen ligase
MGLYKVIFDIGGFIIIDQYSFAAKNQIAPIISSATIILFYLLINNFLKDKRKNIFVFILFIVLFAILIIARGRAAIVATVICCLFLFFTYSKKKIITVFLLIVIGIYVFPFLYDSFFLNHDVNDMNDISSGRINIYERGLQYWLENFWFGEIFATKTFDFTPHNFVLLRLVNYGVAGGSLSIFLYLTYICFIIKSIKQKKKEKSIYNLGYILLIIPFIISLFEYTFPFGPGTSQLINFFMFGQFLRHEYRTIKNEAK